VSNRFEMLPYDDLAEDMTLNGWVDVALELANQIFRIWNSECTFQGELEEELDDGW